MRLHTPDADLAARLETFLHHSAELLRREGDLLLHGTGLPTLATPLTGRCVVVAAPGAAAEEQLGKLRVYLREQVPVVLAVGAAADGLPRRRRADVVVLDATDPAGVPSAGALRAARDVVVRAPRGSGTAVQESLDRLGIRPSVVDTGLAAEDVALLLADVGGARLVVELTTSPQLERLLDPQQTAAAGAHLARLRLADRLVGSASVPYLYSGRVRPHHLVAVMLGGFAALAAALGVTPVGQEWADQLTDQLIPRLDQTLRGILP